MRRSNIVQDQTPSRRPMVNTKITIVSAPNQHISVSYQKNQIRQINGIPEKFIPSSNELVVKPIQSTKSHFIDAYSKGKWNLSKVPCPPFMEDLGYMKPPESFDEISRLDAVSKYKDLEHWGSSKFFNKLLARLKREFKVSGVSISLIDNSKCYYKFETCLGIATIPRCVAIDSHALLSNGYFLLLDASQDWRTRTNPLVAGSPYIKFYCGVPLMSDDAGVIGILAIFDNQSRIGFNDQSFKNLCSYRDEIMTYLNQPFGTECHPPDRGIADSLLLYGNKTKSDSLEELMKELGRPTTNKSSLVYEKDGSGGPYNQNQNIRFYAFSKKIKRGSSTNESEEKKKKKNAQRGEFSSLRISGHHSKTPPSADSIDDKKMWHMLFKVGSLKKAATLLANLLSASFDYDLVYILEIRVAEKCRILNEYFPPGLDKANLDSFKFASKLVKSRKSPDEFMTRLVGHHNQGSPSLISQNKIEQFYQDSIHYKAFISEFGLEYTNINRDTVYNHGLLMPFFRHDSKLVRSNETKKDKNAKYVDLYLRSGGFLVALFADKIKPVDSEMVSAIFDHACTYRKIYISSQ
ncbi:hypothetical protein CANMA_001525 [Candida margitis]|uniref:uncharacterized protein n=1 Tax=Candida margitis TaxID=1775924 RepID=UPI002227E9E7|nr:uncharacterized protein CANMA_001525 [Candida margitis]KAI5969457.1 hypothetical protein CANMA_001525 [Candida margitis]